MKQHHWILAIALCVAAMQISGCATNKGLSSGQAQTVNSKEPVSSSEADLGINVTGVHLSLAGYMIDFRYRVTDPEKAAAILDGRVHPYLIDQETGSELGVPSTEKLGSLRQYGRHEVRTDHVYFILFVNPGQLVKAGKKVTLVVSDRKLENLVVNAADGRSHQ